MENDTKIYKVGLDIGSTTIKIAVLDEKNRILYKEYKRHLSDLKNTVLSVVASCREHMGDISCKVIVTGSGGLSMSAWLKLPFEQEVIACTKAVKTFLPQADTVIELGGEDAKVTYLRPVTEQRMNNSCAGGTGSFIDQMAALFHTDAAGLNEYAKEAHTIYPIASRCGVFAKTDIQPLLNDGARKEDIAASIFQAVVNQTIEGLSWGKPLKGRIAFLGGPLYFLTELRKRFIETLNPTEALIPPDGLFFPSVGGALLTEESRYRERGITGLKELEERLLKLEVRKETDILEPLFTTLEEYKSFVRRHDKYDLKRMPLAEYSGEVYLGLDAGSTTLKAVLIGEKGELLYEYYGKSAGEPVLKTAGVLEDIYRQLPKDVRIARSCVTGYGEELIKRAFHIDMSEIETIAHLRGARHFEPRVDFILDIGGQDMKCLRLKNGVVDSILLNEACSSGCGSFLESFAASLNLTIGEFARLGLFSLAPVDLGTKCTVFMNSKVKQAQKEGADVADLSAGLSYSVIKNALYKVIKIRDEKELGQYMVVQGGTFLNDSVLRCFEKVAGRKAIRPKIAGLMGAFGAALLAKDTCQKDGQSTIKEKKEIKGYRITTENKRCESCANHCLLTVNHLSETEVFITGNRCERGLGVEQKKDQGINLYAYKYKKLFSYKPLAKEEASRGIIGIPRTLSMYESYPFWFTLFTNLGFRVQLSAPSSKEIYHKGMDSIPADSVCYPAKLSHGHVKDLAEKGIRTVFYPSVVYEKKEYEEADNCFNCPIVISYGEVLRNNMEANCGITFLSPFLNMNNDEQLAKNMTEALKEYSITLKEVREAVKAARKELNAFKEDIRRKGEETIAYLKKTGQKGIVLCGKPYHIDPEIHHGIPEMIESFGYGVLTEDSIAHLVPIRSKLRVVDQWAYNSRLYRAAEAVGREDCLEFVQLNSFGCGLDSVTSDQLIEILASMGKQYTLIKIDEGSNLGAARIRIRSLIAAAEERKKRTEREEPADYGYQSKLFTKENRKQHTILAPQMAPIHFEFIKEAANRSGYRMEVLPEKDEGAIEEGLRYVNNDACYPAVLLIGQIVHALKSGKYDIHNTSVIISQTGGGCRATNYMSFLKLGLKQAGFENIPIISLNVAGLGEQPGFQLAPLFVKRMMMAVLYGDLFMRLLNGTRPYELEQGTSQDLYEKWKTPVKMNIRNAGKKDFDRNIAEIVRDFDKILVSGEKKPKVAIVGEILAKYHPMANEGIIRTLEEGGAEVVLPDFLDFFFYSLYNSKFKHRYLGGKKAIMDACSLAIHYLSHYRKTIVRELQRSSRFNPPSSIEELAEKAQEVLSLGNQTGEGWLITAEMVHNLESGVSNILCVQPLACLPNHITGRGMFKTLKERYPKANIMPIDYDPGISQVNQINRVKLMLSVALQTDLPEEPALTS